MLVFLKTRFSSLIISLIVIVVVVTSIQQHKEKLEAERRVKVAKQKAIIDESEDENEDLNASQETDELETDEEETEQAGRPATV